jgi:hypothetical protein
MLQSLAAIRGTANTQSTAAITQITDALPDAVTETTLGEAGIERRTKSAFGLFGFMASFLAPQPAQN